MDLEARKAKIIACHNGKKSKEKLSCDLDKMFHAVNRIRSRRRRKKKDFEPEASSKSCKVFNLLTSLELYDYRSFHFGMKDATMPQQIWLIKFSIA